MKINGAQLIIKLLEREGVTCVAGMPGGAILPIYDALYQSDIRHLLARHEQGAGFIAQGYARASGGVGVCMATSGPGATNLVTPIADAYMDSIPLVAITGQVPGSLIGSDAFQEVDACGISRPITKYTYFVEAARDLLKIIPEAFRLARKGRPGPVLVDVPKDVQLETLEFPGGIIPDRETQVADSAGVVEAEYEKKISRLVEMIRAAERPVLYLGGGLVASGAHAELLALAEKNSLPAVSTLMGLGVMPAEHPLFLGMLGMHAAPYTNLVLERCDLLVALGARFDDRATGKVAEFCSGARIAHVDIDPGQIGKIKEVDLGIVGDLADCLRRLGRRLEIRDRSDWSGEINTLRREHPMPRASGMSEFFEALAGELEDEDIITSDVGQHQMWVAQFFPFRRPRTFLTSGGLGTMGFGLPAAIGAALAGKNSKVVCISGDGSFLLNNQELALLAETNLDVKIIVLNNNHLGMVRQQQKLFYEERYSQSRFSGAPDFAALARAFGVPGFHPEDLGQGSIQDVLSEFLNAPGPGLLEAPVSEELMVLPMVAPGGANRDMILPETPTEVSKHSVRIRV